MCKKSKQTELSKEIFPHYLSNQPEGVDLFEGKSQERLAESIACHIIEADKVEKTTFARLIGLEGKWGSGKSNVIKMIEEKLPDNYTFFCFDAWGNQEDLQRRSILELLTRHLIKKKILVGKTKIRRLSAKCSDKLTDEECTWDEKLESLLSRKSYTKNITVPSLNNATKWFVLVLLLVGLFATFLSVDKTNVWWANVLIALSPMLIFTVAMFVTKSSWRKMFEMYNTEGRSDTTSFVISEQEPSVREFKEWMKEISNCIPPTDRLVLVFDNMDRLPSEKVHQFWSLIQTFFADVNEGYHNIWCIVPYDESHLAAVFSGESDNNENIRLLRGFLNKTFPVIYRVPEPIVADYKLIFEQLFRKAFGDIVCTEDVEAISRCYRHIHTEPNVREIITFINSNVMLVKEWGSTLHPLSIAIYVLKSDAILRNPKIITIGERKQEVLKETTTEEYLLSNEYYNDFRKLMFGYPSVSYLQNEIAALVYGVEPTKAQELVVKRHIRNCMTDKENKLTFDQYVDTPQFMHLLEDDVHNMDVSEYEKAVLLINRIDTSKLSLDDQARLEGIWQHWGRQFNALKSPVSEYSHYHSTLFKHLSTADAQVCVTTFCHSLIGNTEVDGTQLYIQLMSLFNEDYAQLFDINSVCPASTLDAKRFADYVKQAGSDYTRFPLKAHPAELNNILKDTLQEEYPYLHVLTLLKDDEDYTVAEVGNYAVQQFDLKQANALTAANLIAVQRVFFPQFQNQHDANYIQVLWNEVRTDEANVAYDEIYALKAVVSNEALPDNERHINTLVQKVFFYNTSTQILQQYLANINVNFRRKLLIRMLNENIHDSHPDYPSFVETWHILSNNLGVNKETIVRFADSWGYYSLSDQAKQKTYFNLLNDVTWIDVLIAANTPLSKELLSKCVAEMAQQHKEQYLQPNTANHTNSQWSQALQKLVGTGYITQSSFGPMVEIAASLLDYIAKNTSFSDSSWDALLAKVDYAAVSASFMDIRNKIFRGDVGYAMTPAKFLKLHAWLELSEINTADHCADAANQILAKVVDDTNCQATIVAKGDYYRPIIVNTKGTASVLHEKLKNIMQTQSDTDFSKYLKEIIDYEG